MRVLTVLSWLNPGGIEVQLLQAVPWLQQQGVTIDFCCTGPVGMLDSHFEALGCRIHRLTKTPNCYATARHLQRLLRHEHYDVVHSHLGHSSGGFTLGSDRLGVPSVVSFHSAMPLSLYRWRKRPVLGQLRSAWLSWHRRLIRRHAQMLVGHSQINLDGFAPDWRRHHDRCRIIMNGVDFPAEHLPTEEARQRLGVDADANVLLHVGSMKPEKNHAGLLAIFQRVLKQKPRAQLVLVGDGRLAPIDRTTCPTPGSAASHPFCRSAKRRLALLRRRRRVCLPVRERGVRQCNCRKPGSRPAGGRLGHRR